MLVLETDRFLDLVIFGSNPWVVDIAVAVEFCEGLETFIWAVVVDEPTIRKEISSRGNVIQP